MVAHRLAQHLLARREVVHQLERHAQIPRVIAQPLFGLRIRACGQCAQLGAHREQAGGFARPIRSSCSSSPATIIWVSLMSRFAESEALAQHFPIEE
jgi:hypothetical protein